MTSQICFLLLTAVWQWQLNLQCPPLILVGAAHNNGIWNAVLDPDGSYPQRKTLQMA